MSGQKPLPVPLSILSFLDICPPSLASDPQVQALAFAIDNQMQAITAIIPENIILGNLLAQTGTVLDIIAVGMNVPFYQSTLTVTQKIQLIQGNFALQYTRGTVQAVTNVLDIAFAYAEILEWFQPNYPFSPSPYHFAVYTTDPLTDPTRLALCEAAITAMKPVSRILDGIVKIGGAGGNVYVGGAVAMQKYQIIR